MTALKKIGTPEIVVILSMLTAVFWCLAYLVNVYDFAVVGAIFEILWLPMIALLFVLPVLSLIYLVKEKFNVKSLYLYSLLIVVAAILFLISRS